MTDIPLPSMTDLQDKILPLYCNGSYVGTIPFAEALLSAKDGGVELKTKGRGRKWRVTAVHLVNEKMYRWSPRTLTRNDSENNAVVHPGAVIDAKDSIRSLDRAVAKVAAWPTVHDDKAPVISAGKVYGATLVGHIEDRVVTFA